MSLAWRAHPCWVVRMRLSFYGVHVFVRLMFLLRWLAWRAHAVWVLLALLYFYCVHAFFSELEVSLSPELSDTLVVEDVGTSNMKIK